MYKTGDKVRASKEFVQEWDLKFDILEVERFNGETYVCHDCEGNEWLVMPNEIIGALLPVTRKRKKVDLSYRMALKEVRR